MNTGAMFHVPPTPPVADQPTQAQRPGRSTFRTALAAMVGLVPLVPTFVETFGLQTVPVFAVAVSIAAGLTRLLASPRVEAWLVEFAPFLSAEPDPTPGRHRKD